MPKVLFTYAEIRLSALTMILSTFYGLEIMEHSVRPIGSYAFENLDLTNSLSQLYEKTESVSTPVQEFPEVEVTPIQSISKLQMRRALIYFDVLTQVEEAIALESEETQQSWYSTKDIQRDDKFLNEITKKLHFTDRQIDYIFEIGASL
jgi:hypothetical protein